MKLTLAGLLILSLIAVAACSEEEAPPLVDSPSPSPTAANPEEGTVVPPPPPLPTPVSIPGTWATFVEPAIPGLTFRYPAEWHQTSIGTFYSFDPSAPNITGFPSGGVKLQFDRTPLGSPVVSPRPPEATDTELGGLPAWEVARTFDPITAGPGRAHLVAAEVNGYVYVVVAHFTEQDADETLFLKILSTVLIV